MVARIYVFILLSFSHQLVSNSLRPNGLYVMHQASLSLTISWSLPGFISIESVMPSSHFTCVALFSFCPQSSPASGSFLMSWLFASNGQGIGISASASVLPMNIQGWFPLGLTGLISLLLKGLLCVYSTSQMLKGWQDAKNRNGHHSRVSWGKVSGRRGVSRQFLEGGTGIFREPVAGWRGTSPPPPTLLSSWSH